ncbi:hypothetical protein C8R42DRAFT_726472 [Lentinula raphanica]|nr:hypothetical protein C8R42DRAFT_726472 [Lentinula raphanica]
MQQPVYYKSYLSVCGILLDSAGQNLSIAMQHSTYSVGLEVSLLKSRHRPAAAVPSNFHCSPDTCLAPTPVPSSSTTPEDEADDDNDNDDKAEDDDDPSGTTADRALLPEYASDDEDDDAAEEVVD